MAGNSLVPSMKASTRAFQETVPQTSCPPHLMRPFKAAYRHHSCLFPQSGAFKRQRLLHDQRNISSIAPPGDRGVWIPQTVSGEWDIREAGVDDFWDVSQLHCRNFHPTDWWPLAVLQRFERLGSFQAVEAQIKAGWGKFACLVAVCSPQDSYIVSADSVVPDFLSIFVPQRYKAGFERPASRVGIVGTVCIDSTGQFLPMVTRNGRMYRRQGVAYLSNLAVDRNFRRKGIGRALLAEAAEVARGWGCRSITLQCDPRNKGAREMYVQGGYRHVSYESPLAQYWEGRVGVRLELMCKYLGSKKQDIVAQ